MANLETIRKLTVHAESRGLEKLAGDLQKVSAAQGSVAAASEATAVASDKASKSVLSATARFESLERSAIPAAKELWTLERAMKTLGQAADQGIDAGRINAVFDALISNTREAKEQLRAYEAEQRRIDAALETYSQRAARRAQEQAANEQRLAQLRHEQASQNFGQDVRSLTGVDRTPATQAGATYSALAEEMKRLEALEREQEQIQRMRAEAIGEAFTQGFNDSLRMGMRAIDMGATFTALSEEFDRLEELARARAAHIAVVSQQNIASLTGQNRPSATSQGATFSAMAEEAANYEKQMRLVNEMLQKADPLGQEMERLAKAQQAYNAALAAGEISQAQYTTLMEYSKQRVDVLSRGLGNDGMASNLRLASHQWQNLGFQINDVVTMLASGSSPFQVLATQGGQVYQILAGARGGIAGGMQAVSTAALAAATSTVGLSVALGAVAIAGLAAAQSFRNTQRELQVALNGIGAGSGATVDSLNRIADTAAVSSDLSARSARAMAGAFAASGKITADQFQDLISTTRLLSKAFDTDLMETTTEVAEAMADPARGADALNQKLGFLDDRTRQYIRSLQESGDRTRAQQVLHENFRRSVEGLSNDVNILAKAWKDVKEAASDAWDALGRGANRFLGGGTTQELLDQARQELEALRKQRNSGLGQVLDYLPGTRSLANDSERELTERIGRLEKQLEDAAKRGQEILKNELSLKAGEIIRGVITDLEQLQGLTTKRDFLQGALNDPAVMEKLGVTSEQAKDALGRLNNQIAWFRTATERMIEDHKLELQQIEVRTLAERIQVDGLRAYIEVMRESGDAVRANIAAEAARNRLIAEANRQAKDTLQQARDSASLTGLRPFERRQREIENRYNRLREQTTVGPSPTTGYAQAALPTAQGNQLQTIVQESARVAQQLGISTKDLLTVISFETGGSMRPDQPGPRTKWGRHRGLIQMGEPQALENGVTDFNNLPQQFDGILSYLRKAGVRAGDDIYRIYAAVNTGSVNTGYKSDQAAGGTWGSANDKVRYQMQDDVARADSLLNKYGTPVAETDNPDFDSLGRRWNEDRSMPKVESHAKEYLDEAEALERRSAAYEDMWGPLNDANQSLDEQIALTRRQAQTFGMSTGEITAAAEAQRLLNEYARAGVPITEDMARGIAQYAQRAGQAAMETEALAERQRMLEDFADIGKDALKGFISDLRAGKSGAEALANALDRVLDRLLDMAMDSLFSNKSGGGLLGMLLGSFGGGGSRIANFDPITGAVLHEGGMVGIDGKQRYVHPAYFENAPRYHNGMGLAHDERAAILQTGEVVLSRDDVATGRSIGASMNQQQSSGPRVIVNNNGPTQATAVEHEDGSIEVIIDAVEGHMANKASRGKGSLYKASTARAGNRTLRG